MQDNSNGEYRNSIENREQALGESDLKFQRKHFIKNLFNHKQILNSFTHIEFENIETFKKCISNDLFTYNQNIELFFNINSVKELIQYNEILHNTQIYKTFKIRFIINSDIEDIKEFMQQILFDNIHIYTSSDNIKILLDNPEDNLIKFITQNPLFSIIKINKDNFSEVFENIIYDYLESRIRFIHLDIDYESFEKLQIEELHLFKFWYDQLRLFSVAEKNALVINTSKKLIKTLYIDEELKLYINIDQKNDGEYLIDLKNHLGKTGEDIGYKELNKFRSYSDWLPNYGNINYFFINFWQNYKVMGNYVELPYFLQIIKGF